MDTGALTQREQCSPSLAIKCAHVQRGATVVAPTFVNLTARNDDVQTVTGSTATQLLQGSLGAKRCHGTGEP